jgi:hypothetical protein
VERIDRIAYTARAIAMMLGLTLGPLALGAATPLAVRLGLGRIANFTYGTWLVWGSLFLPYFGTYQQPPFALLLSIPVAESVIAGLILGRSQSIQSGTRIVLASLATLILFGLLGHGALRALGIGYSALEGP